MLSVWRTKTAVTIREIADMVRRSPAEDFSAEMFNNRAMVRLYAQSADSERSSIRMLESLARAARAE
jgi:hypothetical protein